MTGNLSDGEVSELLELLEWDQHEKARNRIYTLFPDADAIQPDGTLIHAREKYPKHLEFFAAGAQYRERCAMAANRCITPWTFVDTDQGVLPAAEAWTATGVHVLSQDGESQSMRRAVGGILLGIEPAFRVLLDNGQFFDSNHRHRVSTVEGWLSLDQLVSLSGGLRLWSRPEDYEASCVAGGYLDDRPLPRASSSGQVELRLPAGAPQSGLTLRWSEDASEPRFRCSHVSQEPSRLSNRDDLHRFSGLFAHYSRPASATPYRPLTGCTQEARRLATAVGVHLQADGAYDPGQFSSTHFWGDWRGCLDEEEMQIAQRLAGPSGRRSLDVQRPGGSVQEFHRDGQGTAIFYPWRHPSLTGGRTILAIVPLGLQPIIDAHVPLTNCYWAGGVLHHNTGKTYGMGGYETACHLTGDYPHWWPGRKFDAPTRFWAAGKTNETTRDIVQATLLGEIAFEGARKTVTGTGLIPGALIGGITWKAGVPDLVDTVKIKHKSGKWSSLGFKSYQQGRGSYEGTSQHGIWLDEEPPIDIYGECLTRTATVNGLVYLTFTPLEGCSETVMQFLPGEWRPDSV